MDTYDLTIYQGQTYSLSSTLRNADGSAMNLSGYAISGFIKTKYSDSGILVNLNAQITSGISGTILLSIPATGTSAMPVNYAFYDVELFNSGDNSTTRVLMGKAVVYPEVTY